MKSLKKFALATMTCAALLGFACHMIDTVYLID